MTNAVLTHDHMDRQVDGNRHPLLRTGHEHMQRLRNQEMA